jgi:hypothetical protein
MGGRSTGVRGLAALHQRNERSVQSRITASGGCSTGWIGCRHPQASSGPARMSVFQSQLSQLRIDFPNSFPGGNVSASCRARGTAPPTGSAAGSATPGHRVGVTDDLAAGQEP